MADEKNNLPDSNSEEKKNTGKKKPDKKLIIGIAAAVAVVAIVVGIIVGVSSGGKEKYTEKPVSTTAGDSQGQRLLWHCVLASPAPDCRRKTH